MADVSGGRVQGRPRLDWMEGGLRQQRDDGGSSETIHDRLEGVENPGAYVDD